MQCSLMRHAKQLCKMEVPSHFPALSLDRLAPQGIGRMAGKGAEAGGGGAADGTPQGGLPCAPGCERHGNCNRDSGRCE